MEKTMSASEIDTTPILSTDQFLSHWQGHRALTRRMIEVYPEDKLFTYSIGGMRPFAALVMEMIAMAGPGIRGIATGKWSFFDEGVQPTSKAEILRIWDETTEEINNTWPKINPARFQEVEKAFGQWEGPNFSTLWYFLDNEIHHRGQAYVYLRSLGIEPPAFWDRH